MFLGIAERMNKEIVALAPSAMKIKIIFCFKNLIALFLLVIFFPSFLFISIKIIFQFFIAFMFPPTNNYELTQLQLPSLQLNYPASNSTTQPPTQLSSLQLTHPPSSPTSYSLPQAPLIRIGVQEVAPLPEARSR